MTSISISLNDSRLKNIAEIITNKTCVKILDFLAGNEKTTSEIAMELKIPINTVDYNIKKMLKSGLIEKKNFWWSKKGKKMPTYCVANNELIIQPIVKKSNLKYLIAAGLSGIVAIFIKLFSMPKNVAVDGVQTMAKGVVFNNVAVVAEQPNLALWFLAGSWSIIFLFFVYSIISERREKWKRKTKQQS